MLTFIIGIFLVILVGGVMISASLGLITGLVAGTVGLVNWLLSHKTPGIILGVAIVATYIPGIPQSLTGLAIIVSIIWLLVNWVRGKIKNRKTLKSNRIIEPF